MAFLTEKGHEAGGAASQSWAVAGGSRGLARERGLSRDALEYWKRRIPAKPSRQGRPPLTLIPVRPARPAASRGDLPRSSQCAPIELVDARRPALRIRLPAGFDAESLACVLDVLESRC
ncbi:MAG: hypothetical protein L6Q55_15920 [Azonexus sp.]|nr:hypothetical protein [Azonexus sp.]MCK6413891.1 hypothetical protein [Azonexus sp.]